MNDKDTYRMHTKVIQIGDRKIGGGNPIAIQSMTNTKTEDVKATVEQILRLEKAGCEIIRCTVPTLEAAAAIREIKKQIHIPLVADIHFDYRMALAAIENGADKIRINPGNIGSVERVKAVVDAAKERNIPIRVGVNSGSLEKPLVEKYGGVTAEALAESALGHVHLLEECGFGNICISVKCVSTPSSPRILPATASCSARAIAPLPCTQRWPSAAFSPWLTCPPCATPTATCRATPT